MLPGNQPGVPLPQHLSFNYLQLSCFTHQQSQQRLPSLVVQLFSLVARSVFYPSESLPIFFEDYLIDKILRGAYQAIDNESVVFEGIEGVSGVGECPALAHVMNEGPFRMFVEYEPFPSNHALKY